LRRGEHQVAKADSTRKTRPWYTILYVQVLVAVLIGCAIGGLSPKTGMALKPLGDAFVSLIRMMIAPVIFCVIVQGHRFDERPEEGRNPRRENADLF